VISETEFAELGNSLSTGFFADKVVLTLARIQRLGKLREEDRPVLDDADHLLGKVLAGEKWLETKILNSESAESAIAFDRAVHAIPSIRITREFVDYINELRQTLYVLKENGINSDDKIQKVRTFFFNYARAVSAESQRMVERSSEPQGVIKWAQQDRVTI
jgi:hypothetical protein